jgi:hypothetical protein
VAGVVVLRARPCNRSEDRGAFVIENASSGFALEAGQDRIRRIDTVRTYGLLTKILGSNGSLSGSLHIGVIDLSA